MRPVGALIVLLGSSSCASIPGDDGEHAIAGGQEIARGVELCRTRVADLQARLGAPSRDGRLGGTRVVTWVVEWDPLVKYLGVMADDAGTVVDIYWDLPSEVQWSPVNRCK